MQKAKKIPLGQGDVESWVFDGQPRARTFFLETVRRFYPQAFEDFRATPVALDWPNTVDWTAWKHRWRLTDNWIIAQIWCDLVTERDAAEIAASTPKIHPDALRLLWSSPELDTLAPEHGGLLPTASPQRETRREYLAKAAAHYDARAKLLVAQGHKKTRRRQVQHFEWLAHYTAGGLSVTEIARRFPTEAKPSVRRDAVRKGMKDLAAFLDLTLLPK